MAAGGKTEDLFDARGAAPTWPDLLRAAQSPREILSLVRDFIATWTPDEIHALPAGAQPPLRFHEPEDVVEYAFELSQLRLAGDESPGLERMWRFFMEAAQCAGIAMTRKDEASRANLQP